MLPVDSTVRFNLTTRDVNHSFWLPELLEKRDLPGMMKLMEHHLDESKQTCLEAVSNHKY